jgi:uncharacterized protein
MSPVAILLLALAVNTTVKLPNGKAINAEVAKSAEELGRGLLGRKSLPADTGMLFVYPTDIGTKYNLMGYAFPIDILYIDENKQIINLKENASPCKIADCGYLSIWPHRYALQVPAGTVKRLTIHVGDVLSFELPAR